MKKTITTIILITMATIANAQSIDGDWQGKLNLGMTKLTIVLHLADGKCTMDSPDQNAKGIPAEVLYNEHDSLAVEIKMIGAKYCANLSDGRLVGTFSQRGISLPLDMSKGETVRLRPQTPQPPFPYQTEGLTFTNDKDSTTLAGTLTLPNDTENPVLVVMVSGSGQQNRDEEIFGHRPFAVIADHLARNGIASFRYDDRGVGESNGLRADLTTEDFRNDALCALRMLRAKGISQHIGILGHSEGGLIAFIIAGEQPDDIDFVISLAGTAISGEKVILGQMKKVAEAQNMEITDAQAKMNMQIAAMQNPWYKFFVEYDPTDVIKKISCPVFALNGTKDVQVIAEDNIPVLRDALKQKKSDQIKVYEGLNHLFQHATTGLPDEYGEIEETISEEVLNDLVDWLKMIY